MAILHWMILATVLGAPPTTAPAESVDAASGERAVSAEDVIVPSDEIVALLGSASPEDHLLGFTMWYAWSADMPDAERDRARRYLGQRLWMESLGSVALYEMYAPERRVEAYRLLTLIGGQQVFPYFVWGIGDNDEHGPPGFVKDFFEAHGDPTVVDYLPMYRWHEVRSKIHDRWATRKTPDQTWVPIDPGRFVRDLSSDDASRRRLAIRALTVNDQSPGIESEGRYRRLLRDDDVSVRETAVEALTIVQCPGARAMLKDIADDDAASIGLRRTALFAVANCGIARRWTAEWMLDRVSDWPVEMDETVEECIVRMRPGEHDHPEAYLRYLAELRQFTVDDRAAGILDRAMGELK